MALQDTYAEAPALGVVGAIADTRHRVLISRTIEGADGDVIAFGVPVAQGDADYGARATTGTDTAVLGIVTRDQVEFTEGFAVGRTARVMTTGTIWVNAAVDVSAGDPVNVVVADGTFSNTGGVEIDGARFEDSASAGALVRIRLD